MGNGDRNRRYAEHLAGEGWTCHPPGTSCIGQDHAYQGKQSTSRSASIYVLPKTGTQREKVLDYLTRHGPLSDVELQYMLRMDGNSERPRREELVEGGFVRDSGKVRLINGTEHKLWEVDPAVYQGVVT